jgi:hypothetical protein
MPTITESIAITENNAATGRTAEIRLAGTASSASGPPPRSMPVFIPSGQLYYWSYAWQDAERKAMDDLRAGRSRSFDDPMAAVRYLLGSDR